MNTHKNNAAEDGVVLQAKDAHVKGRPSEAIEGKMRLSIVALAE